MSLRSRALLAIALYVAFHLLAVGLVGALLWLPYAEWRYMHRVDLRLVGFGIGGAFLIVRALIPQRERFEVPGPELTAREQPRLFAMIEEVAGAAGQAMPSHVYLVPDVNAFVAEPPASFGLGARRVLGIGLPLLAILPPDGLRAVLAHEFGHYAGGDTQLGAWVWRTRAGIERTLVALSQHSRLLQKPFEWYAKAFLRISHAVSRREEFAADAFSARIAGARPAADALVRIAAASPALGAYYRSEVGPLLERERRPPIGEGFAQFLVADPIAPQVVAGLDAMLREAADPYATHPTLGERLAALEGEAFDGTVAPLAPSNRALALLDDPEGAEEALAQFLRGASQAYVPIGWDDVARDVLPASWCELAAPAREGLRGLTPEVLPEELGRWTTLAVRLGLSPEPSLVRGAQRDRVHELLGLALALALHARRDADDGGSRPTVHAPPGEPVSYRVADRTLRPFAVPAGLSRGDIDPESWRAECAAFGILGADLGAFDVPATVAAPPVAAPVAAPVEPFRRRRPTVVAR